MALFPFTWKTIQQWKRRWQHILTLTVWYQVQKLSLEGCTIYSLIAYLSAYITMKITLLKLFSSPKQTAKQFTRTSKQKECKNNKQFWQKFFQGAHFTQPHHGKNLPVVPIVLEPEIMNAELYPQFQRTPAIHHIPEYCCNQRNIILACKISFSPL